MNISMLHRLRETELEAAVPFFPGKGRLLEIGAGTGVQAQLLRARGYDVVAIDLADSNYKEQRICPIVEYDGIHIPAEASSFDAIFSSNTLEHVAEITSFLAETKRVLNPCGVSVHIMPTFTWRLSSALGHYLRFDRVVVELAALFGAKKHKELKVDYRHPQRNAAGSLWRWIQHRILPPRHGERGNLLSEHYYFTEHSWRKVFGSAGFKVLSVTPNRLYYSGHFFFGERLSLRARRGLSAVLGSSCKIYVLAVVVKK
jgi:ubiquinone/menaquinone biosynthesis C-methylase UbiE